MNAHQLISFIADVRKLGEIDQRAQTPENLIKAVAILGEKGGGSISQTALSMALGCSTAATCQLVKNYSQFFALSQGVGREIRVTLSVDAYRIFQRWLDDDPA